MQVAHRKCCAVSVADLKRGGRGGKYDLENDEGGEMF